MLPTNSHITMVVGVDVHVTTAPPFNPIHPYIGMVMDVADYIPFLGTNVSVNGLKRGVSDTGGMIIPLVHIPLAGPFAMASMIGHESMNFFASQTVFCDGTRMSPKDHMSLISRHYKFRWGEAVKRHYAWHNFSRLRALLTFLLAIALLLLELSLVDKFLFRDMINGIS